MFIASEERCDRYKAGRAYHPVLTFQKLKIWRAQEQRRSAPYFSVKMLRKGENLKNVPVDWTKRWPCWDSRATGRHRSSKRIRGPKSKACVGGWWMTRMACTMYWSHQPRDLATILSKDRWGHLALSEASFCLARVIKIKLNLRKMKTWMLLAHLSIH